MFAVLFCVYVACGYAVEVIFQFAGDDVGDAVLQSPRLNDFLQAVAFYNNVVALEASCLQFLYGFAVDESVYLW